MTDDRALGHALVTGASGFLGRALCGRLRARGARVRALMRRAGSGPWDEAVAADIASGPLPEAALRGVDAVFHLAARVHAVSERRGAGEDAYRRVNVEGTRRVVDAAVAAGASGVMFVSSVKAMGEGREVCLNEEAAPAPETPYGRSKLEAEGIVLEAGARHGLHASVLRLPLVYGAGAGGHLAAMLGAVARGRFPPLADPGNRRSLVHVADAVEAAILAASSSRAAGRVYLVTDGRAYSTRALYEMMCEAAGRAVPRWRVPLGVLRAAAVMGDGAGRCLGRRMPFDSEALGKLTGSAWYSSARIERELGFRPAHTLADALPEMVAAWRAGAGRTGESSGPGVG